MTTDINTVAPTEAETIAYLSSLPTRVRLAAFSSLSADQDKSDSVAEVSKDAPAIVAFADGVSAENRSAVLLGVEFAETVATSKVSVDSDPVQWLKEYALALRHAGWLTVGGSEYGEYKTSNTSLTMDSVVMELVSAIAGPNAATVLSLMNIVLDKLQNSDPVMKLFERNAKSGNKSSFRIVPCVESSTGIPVTYLISVHATYHTETGGALFWKWSVSRMSVKRLAKGVQFSKESFERNKERINGYLGGEADDFFNSLKK
ncbi:hypothetical protein [Pseudomonas petrae]|uniref:Uncharacterized protein n=1 Tax=Pseudomonas petrae TaxID=2912190 RepID=A0ABS9I5I8_9PSED|nr:hypothetical protein [Pseudomonas petrae]MCF7531889.1 hypothetical protein [Pseudomonas petrae]MCF7537452.1 hypothetical protein [Pseudomonas petrae]MCF7542609.1 hypothetical protein [Pseudomonas petrae]MCF7556791.1 hypothetical protein [Pseudomonas petrae]